MNNLTYLVNWGKDKKNAWSGTNYSLYKALCKYYNIKDVNLKSHPKLFWKIIRLCGLEYETIDYYFRHVLSKKHRNIKGTVFQFSEILQDTPQRKTYLYVDQTVSYVKYMYEHLQKEVEACGFLPVNDRIIEKRAKEQELYMRTCSGVFTMGYWLRNWLISQGMPANKIHAVGGGTNVNIDLIEHQEKAHNKILFVGKDFKRKGGYITYEAFKLLRQKDKNVELYVIGPAANPIDNPTNGYHFIGQIPFEEEAKYYNMCDVFCMPSYFEAYGLVFVEALTFGLPCIGRNCYEMPYFIQNGETGLLLNNDDPKELASLMYRTLHEETFSQNVLSRREEYIHEYSWDTVAKRIVKVIGI